MSFNVIVTENFRRAVKPLAKKHASFKNDLASLIDELETNPEKGEPLGNNLYKIRLPIKSKGRGKSGGARVITCVIFKSQEVLLADVYDKADYETVNEEDVLLMLKRSGYIQK